jgi:predicted DsbA family dithiol-disulfide isomerase
VTVVEYGDFECPFCGQAELVLRELLRDFTDVRYVWRHLPLTDVHVHAQLAAQAAEAAAEQSAFWEMRDLLLDRQDALNADDLIHYAEQLGLDVEHFTNDLRKGVGAARVADDVDGADLSGVNGTPTFFINGRRHYGAYDIETLSAAVRAAGARAMLARALTPTPGNIRPPRRQTRSKEHVPAPDWSRLCARLVASTLEGDAIDEHVVSHECDRRRCDGLPGRRKPGLRFFDQVACSWNA